MIEVVSDNGMNRRNPVFCDLLYMMEFSENPHGYGRNEAMKYRFGFIEGVGGQELGDTNIVRDCDRTLVPILIAEDLEEEPICEIVPNLLEIDLLLVPVTQIRPSDQRVTSDVEIEHIETADEKNEREMELINSIDLSKYSPEKIKAANQRNEEEDAMASAE